MKNLRPYICMASACIFLLAGCAKLGPDFVRPDLGVATRAAYQHQAEPATTVLQTKQDQDKWWTAFGDPELNRLVDAVMENNPDIKKAAAVVMEARALSGAARAERFPTLNIEAAASNQKQTLSTETYSLAAAASFEIDFWGRLARSHEAARADLLAKTENAHTVAQTVVAETVRLYLEIESLERRIRITQNSIQNYLKSLNLVTLRYRGGIASILDLHQARRSLAKAESILPGLMQDLGIRRQQLAVLLGKYPQTKAPRSQPEDYYRELPPVPAGLPAELLLRRPDVRAAEALLQAQNARVGVARAARFPSLTLTGSYGYSSNDLNALFTPQSKLWNLAAGLVAPVFNAGKLAANQQAAEARYAGQAAAYAKTVLNAFSEVEKALLTRERQLERRRLTVLFLEEARATEAAAQSRYERGLTDYLRLLEAQQTRFEAEIELIQVDLAIWSNRVALHRALGGGWARANQGDLMVAGETSLEK